MRVKGLLDKQPHRRNRKAGIIGAYKRDGTIVVRSINKRPNIASTPQSRLDQQTFADIVQAIKNPVDLDMISAVELQQGTSLLWRDILMMAANGTLWTFRTDDGNIIFGARNLSTTIQSLLDQISDVPGTILGRTANGWQALLPGQAGFVLTSQGPASPPSWAPASGGSGGGAMTLLGNQQAENQNGIVLSGFDFKNYNYEIEVQVPGIASGSDVLMNFGDSADPPNYATANCGAQFVINQTWDNNNNASPKVGYVGGSGVIYWMRYKFGGTADAKYIMGTGETRGSTSFGLIYAELDAGISTIKIFLRSGTCNWLANIWQISKSIPAS